MFSGCLSTLQPPPLLLAWRKTPISPLRLQVAAVSLQQGAVLACCCNCVIPSFAASMAESSVPNPQGNPVSPAPAAAAAESVAITASSDAAVPSASEVPAELQGVVGTAGCDTRVEILSLIRAPSCALACVQSHFVLRVIGGFNLTQCHFVLRVIGGFNLTRPSRRHKDDWRPGLRMESRNKCLAGVRAGALTEHT